jgi:dolichol-phosphate mannosyltransferase
MQRDAHASVSRGPRSSSVASEAVPGAKAATDGAREAPLPASPARGRARHHARRVGHGMRKPHNWVQLVKFSLVGASGYVINLAVYSSLLKGADVHYRAAAVLAFCVAVTNNFLWNRHWTFKATRDHAGFQAARFLVVSLLALVFNLIVLELLVSVGGVAKIPAQAIAILAATPLNFVGNKLWSFDTQAPTRNRYAATDG